MKSTINNQLSLVIVGLLLYICCGIAQAEGLIMTSPPREKPAAGKKLYGPLAEHLTQLLGVKVTYKHPGNWLSYQREMRNDAYDIVFDGPHFISWRQEHLKHTPLVKLTGSLVFYLAARVDDNSVNTLDDLIGQKICGISPPNLSTLTILDKYRNPVRQPVIKGVKGGMAGVFKAFKGGKCKAYVFRDTFYKKKLKDEDRAAMKILFKSIPIPNQGISVSRRLSPAAQAKIRESLTIGKGVQAALPIVKRFGGKKAKSFVPTDRSEYVGYNILLEGVIFGW
jgi:ABC-type phosphate/phosphonate transport system substrate-binding protein